MNKFTVTYPKTRRQIAEERKARSNARRKTVAPAPAVAVSNTRYWWQNYSA